MCDHRVYHFGRDTVLFEDPAGAGFLPDGTYGAALARSILRKILVSPIVVTPMVEPTAPIDWAKLCAGESVPMPTMVTSWRFRGVSRFDSIISGGLAKGEVTVNANEMWHSPDALACIG